MELTGIGCGGLTQPSIFSRFVYFVAPVNCPAATHLNLASETSAFMDYILKGSVAMKYGNNVITVYWTEDEQPQRFRDYYCRQLFRRGIIEAHDCWTIENSQNQVCGAFYHITGPKLLVDFLSWLTNLTVGKTHRVDVQTDETGQISQVKEL